MYKIIFCFCFLVGSLGRVYSIDEYRIDETIKVYDSSLKELQTRINYYPGDLPYWGINKPVILYFTDYINYAFIFGKDDDSNYGARNAFIEIIDKCIEWADVAKKNNVHTLSRAVKNRIEILYMMPGLSSDLDVFLADFIFSIQEINKKEEVMLVINYKTVRQVNNQERGSYIVFKERDFNRLRLIFSDNYLIQFDKKAEEQAKKEELFR